MRSILTVLAFGMACYLGLVALMALTQSRQLYLPARALATDPAAHGMVYKDVWLQTRDGVRLHAWMIPAENERGVLLFLHGNAGNISHRMDSIRIFHELGLSVLILDYRGYGQSEGRPDEQGTYLDARAAWEWLTVDRGVASDRIIVFGRSLGSAVAAELATHVRPAAVILESAFTSMPDLAAELMPWLPVRWLLRFDYNTLSRAPLIESPVLIVHSRDDELVPFSHGEQVFAALIARRHFLAIQGGHNDGFMRSRSDYVAGLRRFLLICETPDDENCMLRGADELAGTQSDSVSLKRAVSAWTPGP